MQRRGPYRQAVANRPSGTPARTGTSHGTSPISVRGAILVVALVLTAAFIAAVAQGPGGSDQGSGTSANAAGARSTATPKAGKNGGDQAANAGGTHMSAAMDTSTPAPPGPTVAIGDAAPRDPGSAITSLHSVAPEDLTDYQWPLHRARITSFFDYRDTGLVVINGQRVHEGIDLATFCGDRVLAAHGGRVLAAGRHFVDFMGFNAPLSDFYSRLDKKGEMGNLPIVVVIDDGNGYRSLYVHLEQALVKPGDFVRGGQVIGYEGATGNASGCHLHYGLIRMDGPWVHIARDLIKTDHYPPLIREPVDPLRVLSLKDKEAPRLVPGIPAPKDPPRVDESSMP